LNKTVWGKIAALLMLAFLFATVPEAFSIMPNENTEHVYYGYVPPSTNIPANVDELINGTMVVTPVPPGVAILDVVGFEDGTHFEIWNIYTNTLLYSDTINRFERKFYFLEYGLFFKVISTRRIGVMLSGGFYAYDPGGVGWFIGGFSTFYPTVTGGFRGREFIFMPAAASHSSSYSKQRIGYNFFLTALENCEWEVSDVVGRWSGSGSLSPRASHTIVLRTRKNFLGYEGGAGQNIVYHLTSTGDVMVCSSALGDFVAVPAVTGGYAGKLFYTPLTLTLEDEARAAIFIVLPLEPGKVTVYDDSLNVIAERTFTESEVENGEYWAYTLAVNESGRFKLIVKSEGNICFMVGQTEGQALLEFLGDDITFIGARPNQEIRFYAPTMAILFAPDDLTAMIDGNTVQMRKDEFRLMESGPHTVKANKHIIIQILASGSAWDDWGSYLIEPLDLDATYNIPEKFLEKAQDIMTIILTYVAPAAIVAAVAVFFLLRLRRYRGKKSLRA